jgi:serine/threonine protein kinase
MVALHAYLQKKNKTKYTHTQALGVAKGMAFLHQTRYYDMWTSSYQRCIVHRDLKPQVRTRDGGSFIHSSG